MDTEYLWHLGETHVPQKCSRYTSLKPCVRKDRDLRLKLLLMEKSLHLASDPGPQTPSGLQSPATSPFSQWKAHSSKKVVRKRALTSYPKELPKKKWSPARSMPLVPTALQLSTYKAPGTSSSVHTVKVGKLGVEGQTDIYLLCYGTDRAA